MPLKENNNKKFEAISFEAMKIIRTSGDKRNTTALSIKWGHETIYIGPLTGYKKGQKTVTGSIPANMFKWRT